jgi:hypothetical protein
MRDAVTVAAIPDPGNRLINRDANTLQLIRT